MKSTYMLLTIILILFSKTGLTSNYIECYECSDEIMESKAYSWAYENLNITFDDIYTDVHVINLVENEILSFKVKKIFNSLIPPNMIYNRPEAMFKISGIKVDTPNVIKQPMVEFQNAKAKLKSASDALVIPTSIIQDAWQFTNCAYCENHVESFFNESLSGEILTVQMTLGTLASSFGLLKTAIPNTYRISLEGGGYLQFSVILNNQPISVVVTITKVVDRDGNTVPFLSKDLQNLNISISSPERANQINSYILPYNFYIPLTSGYTTITDCIIDPSLDDENQPCA